MEVKEKNVEKEADKTVWIVHSHVFESYKEKKKRKKKRTDTELHLLFRAEKGDLEKNQWWLATTKMQTFINVLFLFELKPS